MIVDVESVEPDKRVQPGNADQVLTPLMFSFASGNDCVVTPAMRKIGGGKCAITLTYAWRKMPSGEDKAEMEKTVEDRMGGSHKKVFTAVPMNRGEAKSAAEHFLSQRKPD